MSRLPLLLLPLLALVGCSELPKQMATTSWPGCKSFASQAEAQRAWQAAGRPARADSNGDGRVCTSLSASSGQAKSKNCRRQASPRVVFLSRAKYPETSLHIEKAIDMGQPAVLTIQRSGTDEKRRQWQQVVPRSFDYDRDGQTDDRDEYPLAVSAEGGRSANIALVDPSDNRGAGSTIANQLRAYCDGQQFKIRMTNRRARAVRILIVADQGRRLSVEAGG